MLKDLIALFAEKFLENKKSWISSQAYPSASQSISIPWNNEEYQRYVAPSNGVLCVSTEGCSWVRMYSDTNNGRNFVQNNDGVYKAFTLEANKGETINIQIKVSDVKTVQITFIPSNG